MIIRLSVLVLVFAACQGAPPAPSMMAKGHAGAPGIDRFLLLPMNLTAGLSSDLDAGSEVVSTYLREYLESKGREVVSISPYAARGLWERVAEGAESSSAEPDAIDPIAAFAVELGKLETFDAIVIPSLLYRRAQLRGQSVRWDGVVRRIKINLGTSDSVIRVPSFPESSVSAVSLSVLVFVDGDLVFEGVGGLDVAHQVDVFGRRYEFTLREDRLSDEKALRAGVSIAFGAYLPQED